MIYIYYRYLKICWQYVLEYQYMLSAVINDKGVMRSDVASSNVIYDFFLNSKVT